MLRFVFPAMKHFSTLSRCQYVSSANCVEHSIVGTLAKSPVRSSVQAMVSSSRTRRHFLGAPVGFLIQRRVSESPSVRAMRSSLQFALFPQRQPIFREFRLVGNRMIAISKHMHPNATRVRGCELQVNWDGLSLNRVGQATEVVSKAWKCIVDGTGNS